MTQGCGGMLLARGKKWWWITWLLTGSSSSVEVRLDEFISGLAEADNIVTKTGSHGTDWDSSRRRTRYQTLHPWDRLHQHLAKSTSQVSTWKYSQDSSDKRYNQWMHECVMNKDDAHITTIILQDLINKINNWKPQSGVWSNASIGK